MAFDPTTAQIMSSEGPSVKSKFDPSSATLIQQDDTPPQPINSSQAPNSFSPPPEASLPIGQQIAGTLDSIANSPVVEGVNALGGGVQSALANTVGAMPGLKGAENVLAPPDFVKQAQAENPILDTVGRGLGYVGAGGALTAGAGAGLGAIGITGGLINPIAANAIAGSLMAGEDNRGLGAILGGTTAGVVGAASKTISSLANSASLSTRVKNFVNDISKTIKGTPDEVAAKSQANMYTTANAVDAKNFEAFNTATKRTTVPKNAAKAAQTILDNADDPKRLGSLTGPQKDLLEQIASWNSKKTIQVPGSSFVDEAGQSLSPATSQVINNSTKFSVAELHSARKGLDQMISQARTQADRGEISRTIFQDLLTLRKPLEDDLLIAAKKAGIENQYMKANQFYKSTILPLIDTGAKDTAEALKNAATTPGSSAKIIDGLIDRNIKINKPETATAFLNTLDDTGRAAVENRIVNKALRSATNKAGDIDFLKFKDTLGDYKSYLSKDSQKLTDGIVKVIDDGTKLLGLPINPTKGIPTPIGRQGLTGAGTIIGTIIGAPGGVVGSAVGGVVGGAIGAGLSKMLNSKAGQSLLMRLVEPNHADLAKQLVITLVIQGVLSKGEVRPNGN